MLVIPQETWDVLPRRGGGGRGRSGGSRSRGSKGLAPAPTSPPKPATPNSSRPVITSLGNSSHAPPDNQHPNTPSNMSTSASNPTPLERQHLNAPAVPAKETQTQIDKEYDCLSCRVMGSVAFSGLGIYSYASGMSQLKKQEQQILRSGSMFGMRSRKAGIFGLSAALVGMGYYRFRY